MSDSSEDNVIATGVEFVRAICAVHGAEHGMELYETIATVLGDDIKGKIFMSMLLGTHGSKITLTLPQSVTSTPVVAIIKLIRTHCTDNSPGSNYMGLKEAKDLYDRMRSGGKISFNIAAGVQHFQKVAAEFRSLGCIVH